MAGPPDLTRAIAYRSIALNTVADTLTSEQTTIAGCKVDLLDLSDLEIRQFGEPLALADGIDVGGVWLGARRIIMRGAVYDKTRGETYARLSALEDAMTPQDGGEFGFFDLTFYTISGSTPTATQKKVSARPNGLRYAIDSSKHNGLDANPLSIQWAVSMFVKSPGIVSA